MFKVFEKTDVNSTREASSIYKGTLTGAKRKATRGQAFQGTALVIEDATGQTVAFKKNGRWTDTGAGRA